MIVRFIPMAALCLAGVCQAAAQTAASPVATLRQAASCTQSLPPFGGRGAN
jgi:hypothetical protein